MLAANEIARPPRVVVCRITVDLFRFAAIGLDQLVVVVRSRILHMTRPVPNDLIIPVAAEPSVSPGVPFADLRGAVSVLAKDAGPEGTLRRIVVAARIVTHHPHRFDAVAVMPGQ